MTLWLLFTLLYTRPGVDIVERDATHTVIRVNFTQSLTAVGGLIAYSGELPSVKVLTPTVVDSSCIKLGVPGKFRDYHVVPFMIDGSKVCSSVTLDIEIRAAYEAKCGSFGFTPLYRAMIINYKPTQVAAPGTYLVITGTQYVDALQPLVDWKRRKGWHVKVVTLDEIGGTPVDIRNYIANMYQTDNLEYVLLVGDIDCVPAFTNQVGCPVSDHPYSMVDGDDFLPDILIGRLSVANEAELNTVVAKILGYDRSPYMEDTLWYKRGLMVGGNYPEFMTTALATKRWIRQLLLEHGFTAVDTVFYPPITDGGPFITGYVDEGVTFVNYRAGRAWYWGWEYPEFTNDDIYGLNNGFKLPIVTSLVCYTGAYDMPRCFGETWLRAGSPYNPKGGIAFIGPTSAGTHTRWNNCMDYGIYWGILKDSLQTIGQALVRGKLELLCNFPVEIYGADGVEHYFYDYNLLGDPESPVWCDVPQRCEVTHTTTVPLGASVFEVEIHDIHGNPVEAALVSLYKPDEFTVAGFTDANGRCELNVLTQTSGLLYVTITKPGMLPYIDSVWVDSHPVYVGYKAHEIGDDGILNIGDTANIYVTVKNYGNLDATDVTTILRTDDSYVSVVDSIAECDTIPAGGETTCVYRVAVANSAYDRHRVNFSLVAYSDGHTWVSGFSDSLAAPKFQVYGFSIEGDGILEPGEEATIIVSMQNVGSMVSPPGSVILRCVTNAGYVVDSMDTVGELPVDGITDVSFRIGIHHDVTIGKKVPFSIIVESINGFTDTTGFELVIGEPDTAVPSGPDGYGYYAYDYADIGYEATPVYGWVEIDTMFGGTGSCLGLQDDGVAVIDLPFVFRFYGEEYTRISICANGFIAMGESFYNDPYNWAIPSSMGPHGLIAVFWDNFDPTRSDSSGDVFCYYDVDNHRFIVEWSRVQHIHGYRPETAGELQTFEAILMDPTYYPTPTGDGEIILQYHTVCNDDTISNYATVGIQDRTHRYGIEYTFAGRYPVTAARIKPGCVIKFTTVPPDTFGVHVPYGYITDVEIVPNPTCGWIYVEPGLHRITADDRLLVYDALGRQVAEIPLTANGRIMLGDTPGVYFVKMIHNGKVTTYKVVVVK